MHIAGNLTNLTSLNLAQNELITNSGALALVNLSNLKALNLSNTRVNSEALSFFRGMKQLQSLALYGCRGVKNSRNHIETLKCELPNLKCLRVSGSSAHEGTVNQGHDDVDSDDDEDMGYGSYSEISGMFAGIDESSDIDDDDDEEERGAGDEEDMNLG